MQIKLGFPHSLALGLTHCIYGQLLNPMEIHLFYCTHGGERTTSHDVVWDLFASIARDARFHFLWLQTHVLSLPFLQFSCWQVDIVLLVDGTCTLADVIIVDPIQAYLVSWASLFHGVMVTLMAQVKGLYYDRYPMHVFFLLAIESFECLHQ